MLLLVVTGLKTAVCNVAVRLVMLAGSSAEAAASGSSQADADRSGETAVSDAATAAVTKLREWLRQ